MFLPITRISLPFPSSAGDGSHGRRPLIFWLLLVILTVLLVGVTPVIVVIVYCARTTEVAPRDFYLGHYANVGAPLRDHPEWFGSLTKILPEDGRPALIMDRVFWSKLSIKNEFKKEFSLATDAEWSGTGKTYLDLMLLHKSLGTDSGVPTFWQNADVSGVNGAAGGGDSHYQGRFLGLSLTAKHYLHSESQSGYLFALIGTEPHYYNGGACCADALRVFPAERTPCRFYPPCIVSTSTHHHSCMS